VKIYLAGKMPAPEIIIEEKSSLAEIEINGRKEFVATGRFGYLYETNETFGFLSSYDWEDWRYSIAPGLKNWLARGSKMSCSFEKYADSELASLELLGGHDYSGPYYEVRYQQHGCYDLGETNHAQSSDDSARRTFRACCSNIANSDVVFAWIEDFDCFGTLWELGFAFGQGIPVFVATPETKPAPDDLWFSFQSARAIVKNDSPKAAFESFLINYAPALTAELARKESEAVRKELESLKSKIERIGDGRSAAWRELMKEL
jgi:nucleoside 2-deoxyribosyltransferase